MMTSSPEISIIIPTYNHGHLIKRCLQSIIEQTFTDWEAVIINNLSEDNTVQVVRGFHENRFRLVDFHNNGIIAASRNEGIRLAGGEFIAFLDSDDWWGQKKLAISRRYLNSADIVFHDVAIQTPKGRKIIQKFRGRCLISPVLADLLGGGNALATSSIVVRKDILRRSGDFDESRDLISIEDFDLWLRIAMLTERFVYIPRTLGSYWIGGQNTNEMSKRKIAQLKAIYKKYEPFLGIEARKQAELHLCYSIGRIKQKLGNWQEALQLFRDSMKSRNREDRLKALFFIVAISIFRNLSVKF